MNHQKYLLKRFRNFYRFNHMVYADFFALVEFLTFKAVSRITV